MKGSKRSLGLPETRRHTVRNPGLELTLLMVDKTPRKVPLETGGQAEGTGFGFGEKDRTRT